MVLPPLMLLMATYSLALQALLRGVEWLDNNKLSTPPELGITAVEVMGPAIAAAWCLWLLLFVVTLSALWHVPMAPNDDGQPPAEPPSYESLKRELPALLVRESSTLFRQVSARTLNAYNLRYGKLEEEKEEEEVDLDLSDDDLESGGREPHSRCQPCDNSATSTTSSTTTNVAAGGGGGGGGGAPATAMEGRGVGPPPVRSLSTISAAAARDGGGESRCQPCDAVNSSTRSSGAAAAGSSQPLQSPINSSRSSNPGGRSSPTSFSGRFRQSGLALREKAQRLRANMGGGGGSGRGESGGDGSSSAAGGGSSTPKGSAADASPRAQQVPPPPQLQETDIPTDLVEAGQCWVCFADEIRDEAVILHCGHAGLCLVCADNLWRRRLPCPMCRQTISLVAKVGDMRMVDGKLVVSPSLPTKEALAASQPPPPPSASSTERAEA